MAIALSVNLNKVALLRNSRTDNNPNISEFAALSIEAGAAGLTAHPRPDQRHIRPDDIAVLADIAREHSVEFNIEGNPFAAAQGSYTGLIEFVKHAKPDQCTLVPDANDQLTSDHGFNLKQDAKKLSPILQELKSLGVRISLFMDPELSQIELAAKLGADRIELYTGPYAAAFTEAKGDINSPNLKHIFDQHCEAARFAHSLGLGINAGHDLSLTNLGFYCQLPHLQEVSIGHALTADALRLGFANAVSSYAEICASSDSVS